MADHLWNTAYAALFPAADAMTVTGLKNLSHPLKHDAAAAPGVPPPAPSVVVSDTHKDERPGKDNFIWCIEDEDLRVRTLYSAAYEYWWQRRRLLTVDAANHVHFGWQACEAIVHSVAASETGVAGVFCPSHHPWHRLGFPRDGAAGCRRRDRRVSAGHGGGDRPDSLRCSGPCPGIRPSERQ